MAAVADAMAKSRRGSWPRDASGPAHRNTGHRRTVVKPQFQSLSHLDGRPPNIDPGKWPAIYQECLLNAATAGKAAAPLLPDPATFRHRPSPLPGRKGDPVPRPPRVSAGHTLIMSGSPWRHAAPPLPGRQQGQADTAPYSRTSSLPQAKRRFHAQTTSAVIPLSTLHQAWNSTNSPIRPARIGNKQ